MHPKDIILKTLRHEKTARMGRSSQQCFVFKRHAGQEGAETGSC